jgi:hypothetical protein
VSGFLRGAQHLVDEALLLRSACTADAPGPNTQIAVAHGHSRTSKNPAAPTVPETPLNPLAKMFGAARAPTDRHGRTQAMSMACDSTGEPLLSRTLNRAAKVNRSFANCSPKHAITSQRVHPIIAMLPHPIE